MKQILFFFTNETKCYDETTGIDDDQDDDDVETTAILELNFNVICVEHWSIIGFYNDITLMINVVPRIH